jgi:uncharacterized membrane protein
MRRATLEGPVAGLALATGLGCALMGGVFFAFSSFVMPALEALPDAEAIAAMQSINEEAETAVFLSAFGLTSLACVALGAWAVRARSEPAARWILAGCVVYLVLPIGLTMVHHVPLNDHLATVDPHGPEASAEWRDYLDGWLGWNHLRGAGGLAAGALIGIGLQLARAGRRQAARTKAATTS